MTDISKIPDPDPQDEMDEDESTAALDELLDDDLEPDTGEHLPPHGDAWDPVEDEEEA